MGAKPIIWQDPLDAGVKPHSDVVIQMWKDWGEGWINYTQKALNDGYKVIISSPWYINYIWYGEVWRSYYNIDPILDLPDITPEQAERVLGGEACIWGEFVDKTNVVPRLFPFAGAIAERLWSRANSSTVDDAMWRLDQQRCRMLRRGIPAQPTLNGYCGPWETEND
jgi:hexosaminidase